MKRLIGITAIAGTLGLGAAVPVLTAVSAAAPAVTPAASGYCVNTVTHDSYFTFGNSCQRGYVFYRT